jgi:hypothetical protein
LTDIQKLFPRDIRDRPAKEKINVVIDCVAGNIQKPSGSYAVLTTDGIILMATGTATLFTAVGNKDQRIIVKRLAGATITIDGAGSETIDGATTKTLSSQYATLEIVSDGANWHVI